MYNVTSKSHLNISFLVVISVSWQCLQQREVHYKQEGKCYTGKENWLSGSRNSTFYLWKILDINCQSTS